MRSRKYFELSAAMPLFTSRGDDAVVDETPAASQGVQQTALVGEDGLAEAYAQFKTTFTSLGLDKQHFSTTR